jgi:hypothetical protein
MATTTWASTFEISTDAKFRALFSPIHTAMVAWGWTLTNSVFATGTDWTDVSAPSADSTAAVTEIYAMGDALQSTAPCYLKIEYGRTNTTKPAIKITLGTGYTAPSTITNPLYTDAAFNPGGTANANTVNHFGSGASGRACFAFAVTGTGTGTGAYCGFSVERRVNSSGAAVDTGFLVAVWATNSVYTMGSTQITSKTVQYLFAPHAGYNAADLIFDGNTCIAPILYCMGPSEVGLGVVGVPRSAYSAGATLTTSLFGVSLTYLSLYPAAPSLSETLSRSNMQLAIRYD